MDEWQARDELLWKQRVRSDWLKESNKSSTFFKADGSSVLDTLNILSEFSTFFTSLILELPPKINRDWNKALDMTMAKVPEDLNRNLMEPYTEVEIANAIFQMHPSKAPGPDGFSALFYQKFWNLVKEDVCAAALNFLNNGVLDENLNETALLLLPKSPNAQTVEEFRPISLCNVAMKIITKVLANRLRSCLPRVISESQSAFISGRLITDNILVAHELNHHIRHMKHNSEGYLSIKLDMSKAFDRVDWRFLKHMMLRGFSAIFMDKVMCFVETVSYRVKINGQQSEIFRPGRGLR